MMVPLMELSTAGGIAKTHIDDARYYNRALEGYEIKAMTIRSNKLVSYVDTPYSYQIPATQDPQVGQPMELWHPKDLSFPILV